MKRLVAALLLVHLALPAQAQETVTFPASDDVEITGDLYRGESDVTLVLFHMAGASRGEYRDIAPLLVDLGYTVLAIDQRSGRSFGGVRNETAATVGGTQAYADAIPDLLAATAYARETLGANRVGAMGSSYSAALVLVLAGRDPTFADAVMAFSPGEYFSPGDFVRRDAAKLQVPAFITSAKSEGGQWSGIYAAIPGEKTGFLPEGSGRHGATALLTPAGPEYRAALTAFLAEHLPAR